MKGGIVGSRQRYLVVGLATTAIPLAVVVAPPAAADCSSSGGATICSQGEVRGSNTPAPSSGPYYPYPCEYDWYCDDNGLSIIVNPGPPIDIGRPGRPGGGGGGIGPR